MARIDLRENEFMERFVGQDHVDSNDVQFWYQLLSCSFNFMRVQDPKVVDKTLEPYLIRLILNNNESLNIGSLIRVFLDRVSRIKSPSGQAANSYYIFQSFNALYLIRSICKSHIESCSEEQLIKGFRAKVDVAPQASQEPMPAMVSPVSPPVGPTQSSQQLQGPPPVQSQSNYQPLSPPPIFIPNEPQQCNGLSTGQGAFNEDQNHNLTKASPQVVMPTPQIDGTTVGSTTTSGPSLNHKESPDKKADITPGTTMLDQFISTLIAIIVDIPLTESTYMLQVEATNALLVLLSVQMYSSTPANQSVIYRCLMQKKCSIHALILTKTLLKNFVNQHPIPQETGSIIIGLASGLWKVLTLGYGGGNEEEITESMPLLAHQSLILLNILTNHYTTEKNPYREAIVSCQDSRFNLSDPQIAFDNANNDALATATTSKSVLMSNSITIDFQELYLTICKYLHNDQVALLLYLLLHSNNTFKLFILTTASSHLDELLLPLLKILYSSIEKGSHHVYMVIIIFIILSEETHFNEAIRKITIRGVPWYKDRMLGEISLGSLTALIIIRSFQYNTFRIKDKFLHMNLFAALANLSSHFHNLHPYVCQRLVDLLERITKRYMTVTKPSSCSPGGLVTTNQTLEVLNSNNPLAKALATDTHKQELQDASSLELDLTCQLYGGNPAPTADQQNTGAINLNIPEQQVSSAMSNNLVLPPVDQQGREYSASEASGQQSPGSNSTADHINISMDDESKHDISLFEEVIGMILQVINNSLATQLTKNPDLIYTLLYKRSVFSGLLTSHQSFYNMVINVERILTFFYNKIEAFERPLSVAEIKELIHTTNIDWNYDQNNGQNARLLFRYMEDEQPEQFFIPYIWTRIYYSSGIAWKSKEIKLFNPDDL